MPKQKERYSYLDEWKSLWEPHLEAIAYNGATCDPTRVDHKVLEWVQHHCSHQPHFIKIINTGAVHGGPGLKLNTKCQLAVPSPFVKEHFRELGRVVTLENDEGKTWRVSFGYTRTHPTWFQGWKRVAADNDLKLGDVMVFFLVANSRFRFTRFDEDGNIISGKKRTNPSLLATRSSSQSHEMPGSVMYPEDSSHGRTSWKSKRAAAVASRNGHCTEAECGAQPSGLGLHDREALQMLASTDTQTARLQDYKSASEKWLRRMEEIKTTANYSCNESNLATNDEHGSEEARSTSMADSPSTATIKKFPPTTETHEWQFLSRHFLKV